MSSLFRIHEVKKISKRYKKDIKLLVERLDKHGDSFRTASVEADIKPEVITSSIKASKQQTPVRQIEKQNTTGGKKPASKKKSKADKVQTFESVISIDTAFKILFYSYLINPILNYKSIIF